MPDLHAARSLISFNEAVQNRITRLRKSVWNPLDHLKIDIIDGRAGPWLHIYSPFNIECNGRDPVDVLIVASPMINPAGMDTPEFAPYEGPLPESAEYKAAVAA